MAPTGRMYPGGCAGLGAAVPGPCFWREPHSVLKSRRPRCRSCVIPSIVPDGQEPTVYLVLNDFGRYGRAYSETSEERADLETTITDLITGQYDRPVRVVAFNTAEGWSADIPRAKSCAALILPAMNCRRRSKPSSSARRPRPSAHLAVGVVQIIWETFIAGVPASPPIADSTRISREVEKVPITDIKPIGNPTGHCRSLARAMFNSHPIWNGKSNCISLTSPARARQLSGALPYPSPP